MDVRSIPKIWAKSGKVVFDGTLEICYQAGNIFWHQETF